MRKKLLLIGSDSVHTYNFYELIKCYFDEIVLITTHSTEFTDSKIRQKYVINASLKNPLNYFTATHQIRKIIKNEKPDIIHIQQIDTAALCMIKANRSYAIPTVVTAWGSDVLVNPKRNFILKNMVRFVLNHSDMLTADAQFVGQSMQQLTTRPLQITIANFGINTTVPDLPKEKIIYSNRLHKPLYRIDAILRAFKKFIVQHPDWQLVVAGDGTETASLKALASSLSIDKQVKFTGWLSSEENMQYYAKAQYWVSVPESDATAISLLEAMNCGCFPIVSDLPANSEWIQSGENGLIVTAIEDDFISAAMQTNTVKAIQINRQLIAERATKEVNREKFILIYQKLLKQ